MLLAATIFYHGIGTINILLDLVVGSKVIMPLMVKDIDIILKSIRMTLLCLAFVMSGAPVAASMPSHNMSQMMSHAASLESDATSVHNATSIHNDCVAQQPVPAQPDDCCQTDDCKSGCAAHISMNIVGMSAPVQFNDFSAYAAFIDHSLSQLSDPSNPPPIS